MKQIGDKVQFVFGMSGTIVGYNQTTTNKYVMDHLNEVPEALLPAVSFYDNERYPYVVLREDGYLDVYGDESFT